MDARLIRVALCAAPLLLLGASHRTQNFLVTAATPELSRDVAEAAESFRRDLALEWLGKELPPWHQPCPITVNEGSHLGAGGATSFMFENGRPFGWTMTIQGSRERILDSVLPHEVTHTIFATHFGRPLPRWADEGACTTVEHVSEKKKQKHLLIEFLTTGRGIAFNQMFAMKEYPADILPLYAQGFSLARFLIEQGGKQKFARYVGDGMKWNNWTRATQEHYGFASLSELQVSWLEWVRTGSRPRAAASTLVAQAEAPAADQIGQSSPLPGSTAQGSIETVSLNEGPRAKSSPGWYVKVRDETQTTAGTTAAASQVVTRPQPIGRPKQQVLEWDSPHRQIPTQTAPEKRGGRQYLVSPSTLQSTLLR